MVTLDLDFRVQAHRHAVQAERLDRMQGDDLLAIDADAARRDRLGDVARGDGAVELAALTRLADDDEGLAVEPAADLLGLGLHLEVAGLELGAVAFEALLVGFGGAQRLAARQQVIARKAVADSHGLAHLAEFGDAFEQNDFHDDLLLVVFQLTDRGACLRALKWKAESARPTSARTKNGHGGSRAIRP